MFQILTLREVHKTICETVGFPKENAKYKVLHTRTGHGSIKMLSEEDWDVSIFQYVNISNSLLIFDRYRLIGELALHSDGFWYKSAAESVWESRLLIPASTLTEDWKEYLKQNNVINT